MEKGVTGEVYNIGRGQGWKIREILDMLLALSTKNVPVEVDTTRLRPSDVAYFVADNTKVSSLGWSPELAIEHTLERILNEWRTHV
jgi:GDP-4-dehydro-6-deoxy-D-mannose reductase